MITDTFRILILIDWFDPAFRAGGPIQSVANLVKNYQRPQLQVRVFTSNQDLDGSELTEVPHDEWVRRDQQTEVWYASRQTSRLRFIRSIQQSWKPDVMFVNGIFSPCFNFLPLCWVSAPLKVVSVRGMLHPNALAQKSFKKKLYLALWRIIGLHKRVVFHATNEEERSFIEQSFGTNIAVRVAANFPRILSFMPTVRGPNDQLKLVTVALISPMKNHLLVLEQLKKVSVPVQWTIYGPIKDAVYMRACEEAMEKLPAHIKVDYRGELRPSQVAEALAAADAFILPSKSENFGHAIFEALTAGKPVITSLGTPWMDLSTTRAGWNVDVERNPERLKEVIEVCASLYGPSWDRWTTGARERALNQIDSKQLEKAYDHLFAFPYDI